MERRSFLKTITLALGALALGLKPDRGRVVIAAADAPAYIKAIADLQCSGVDDDLVIQRAINYGDSIVLQNGTYNLGKTIHLSDRSHWIVGNRFIGGGFEMA